MAAKGMKTIIASVLLMIFAISTLVSCGGLYEADVSATSGECGPNLSYQIDIETKTMTISGTGPMSDWTSSSETPWNGQLEGITTLVISEGVESIGSYAFYGCTGFIGALSIPSTVTSVGAFAFASCSGFTGTLALPSAVYALGDNAFHGCSGLTGTVTISSVVTSLGSRTFCGSGFSSIEVDDSNPNYSSQDGILFNKDKTVLIQATIGNVRADYSIPNTVEDVGNYAFYKCSGFTGTLTIPSSVVSIGGSAFYMCSGFTGTLTIPSSVVSIGGSAFADSGFSSFDVDESNSKYSSQDGILFNKGKTVLIQATVGNVKSDYVFPTTVTSIGNYAFYRCTGFTGALTIPTSVVSVGSYAFYGCTGFTGTLTIPSSVSTIGNYAFQGCTGFTGTLTIPSTIISINAGVFYGCTGFTVLSLSSTLVSIGDRAFLGCTGLNSLSIPSSVTSIGMYAFQNCTGFSGTLTIPSNVISLGSSAFAGSGFSSIEVDDSNPNYSSQDGIIFNKTKTELIQATADNNRENYSVPSTVIIIRDNAFYGCKGFTGTLTIPSSVTSIGNYAFHGCKGFTGTLTIPSSVTYIGSNAFYGCIGFTGTLTIPSSITSIGDRAFTGCVGFSGALTLESGVKTIGKNAFAGCTGLTGALVIPSTITSIGGNAFYGCTEISSISICENGQFIGDAAFGLGTAGKSVVCDVSGCSEGYLDSFKNEYTVFVYPKHSVTYDVCGGSESAPIQTDVVVGTSFTVAPYHGIKYGFIFGGWNDGKSVYQPGASYEMGPSDVHFAAVWITKFYTVCFDVDGGSEPMNRAYVAEGQPYAIPSYPGYRQGHVFVGWSNGFSTYVPGYMMAGVTSDIYLKAVWTDAPFTAYYDLDGGDGYVSSVTVQTGKQFVIASYSGTKSGFSFAGWSDGSRTYQPGDSYTMGPSDVTFKAVWIEKPSHTISYDVEGGSESVPSYVASEGSLFVMASYSGVKPGFSFAGWSDGSKVYQPGDLCTMGSSDITFEAIWADRPSHTISYDVEGGSESVPSDTVKEGLSFNIASYFGTKAGYSFAGWSDGSNIYQPGDLCTMGTDDVKIMAVWTENPLHTVYYDVCGGTGSVASQNLREGMEFALEPYTGTKTGCTFIGWSDGSRTYQPGDTYTMGTTDLAFKVVWYGITDHRMEYNLNGGEGAISTQYFSEGETFTISDKIPEKAGFDFVAWQYGNMTYNPGEKMIMGDSDIALEAVWNEASADYDTGYYIIGAAVATLVATTIAILVIRRN